ncbi:hypothetical protein T492DRAFT_873982 [Pavlovales sp. CCMP2436]|nr:hypothetical protein T492DRAFT_873982 [Pavlovales sp. CCMP2436]
MNGYSHYMPYAEPGRSFDLVGYLSVSPSLVRAPPGDVHVAIAQLLAALRTTVDGLCLWGRNMRQTGKVQITVTDKCCHCYRMQARILGILGRLQILRRRDTSRPYRPETQRNIDIFSELFKMYDQSFEKNIKIPEGATFPVKATSIEEWEMTDPKLTWSVYTLGEKNDVKCIRVAPAALQRKRRHIMLLIYEGHFVNVGSLDALLTVKDDHRTFCPCCHTSVYKNSASSVLGQKAPVVGYADFEATAIPGSPHKAVSYRLQLVHADESPDEIHQYLGKDAHVHFAYKLVELHQYYREIFSKHLVFTGERPPSFHEDTEYYMYKTRSRARTSTSTTHT